MIDGTPACFGRTGRHDIVQQKSCLTQAAGRVGPCLSVGLALMTLAACASVGPDYRAPVAAELSVPERFVGGVSEARPANISRWWARFGDPVLTQLVDEATIVNLDLAVAAARLTQSREALVQARAGRSPSVSASGGVGGRADATGDASANLSLGADAAWEIDLFGRIRRGIEAARADAEASFYDREAMRVAVAGEVASNYIQARLAQARLALARGSLAIADDNLQIARWRVQAGLVSSLDSEQARSQRAVIAAIIPALEDDFNAAAFRLAVLTGRAPGAATHLLINAQPIPIIVEDIATGIPADALRQRPDVRSAERALAAATARIGVAEAQLYPSLRLSGSIGTAALSFGGLVDAITGVIFAGLDQMLFDGGRLRSQVRAQQASTEAALATYRRSVLTALEDIENALSALTAARQRQVNFAEALDAADNTALLARSQYRAGLIDFRALLEAERSLNSARDGVATSRGAEALASVQLYRAMGGGWNFGMAPAIGTSR